MSSDYSKELIGPINMEFLIFMEFFFSSDTVMHILNGIPYVNKVIGAK
jgi:hypothetical protein